MRKDLGKYPTLLEKQLARRLTEKDREEMTESHNKAEQNYYKHLREQILAGHI